MKIVHVIVGLNVGGAELMLKRLVEQDAVSDQYSHVVISLTSVGVIGEQLKKVGVRVIALGLANPLLLPVVFFRLLCVLLKEKPHIVQTWMYHSDFLGGLAARLAGIKNIIWGVRSTNIEENGSRSTLIIRNICAVLSHYIPKRIVCAAEASREVHAALGYDKEKMIVISNGFLVDQWLRDDVERSQVRKTLGFRDDDFVIGSVGRFNPVKNHALFVESAILAAKSSKRLRFLMVGRDVDWLNKALTTKIENSGFENRFVLLGERSDLVALYSAMDAFCLHSKSEGFPNVVAEAMLMELPCIVTNVGDAGFLVQDNGYVVSQSEKDVANAFLNVALMDGLELLELGRKSRERIVDSFSIESTSRAFKQIYQSLVLSPG